MKIKSGIGFDAHRFSEARPLYLGGIHIENAPGLAGHSDADVLIHAVIDSFAGTALGTDIGGLFPDSDDAYKDIDSKILLKKAVAMLEEKGWKIENVDAVIIAQAPKLAPHIDDIRKSLSKLLKIDFEDVSVKATTTETMGFTGRREGIACTAVSLITK